MVGAVGDDSLFDGASAGAARSCGRRRLRRVATACRAQTGCAAICTGKDGRNLIAVGSGANARARAHQVPDALLTAGNTVLLQMEVDPEETAALIRRNQGARLILNLAPALPLPHDALRAIDILVVNEHEAGWLAASLGVAANAAALHAALCATVVRTLGDAGAEYAGPEGAGHAPAHRIHVIDTTAAGDCFTGVMAASLDRGMALPAALARATAAAAICCTRRGSQTSLPRAAETDRLLG